MVAILLVSAIMSYFLGELNGALIIAVLVVLSVILQFYHEHRSGKAAVALRQQVAVHATALRDGIKQDVPLDKIVPGDIIYLTAGDIVPGDARIITIKDLYVNQASLTGESFPANKEADLGAKPETGLTEMTHAVFMGSNVTSGFATAVIVATGKGTEIGKIANTLTMTPPETEFQRGIREFSLMLMRIIIVLVLIIFFINAFQQHSIFASFLFALAISVGITPELLPMIMTINLANGAVAMSHKGVIVKWLAAIQNFGSMDVLCSDKTGTLTEGEFQMVSCTDYNGNESQAFLHAYLNSTLQGGMKNPLDLAIAAFRQPEEATEYTKMDEIPFDFVRRMLSVVVDHGDERLLLTKGAPESLLLHCDRYLDGTDVKPLTDDVLQNIQSRFAADSEKGYRVIAMAYKPVDKQQATFEVSDEDGLIFSGFLAFFDPPRATAGDTITALHALGVNVKILTGDNEIVARKVCQEVGIPVDIILTGTEIDKLSEEALARVIDTTAVFARLNPVQKNRIIHILKHKGHVVGYIGDGINDAPSLRAADVGISVDNAVDVAKEAAAIILMEKSLSALKDGVIEGRRTFANTMKYIMMGTSSNFGNMFSMSFASLMVPFLPMLPVQILLNNLLYDFSQVSIPTDSVDDDYIKRPRRWDIKFIRHFMLIFGPVSSIFDLLTFGLFLYVFKANEGLFQTGWFVESLATQVLVIHIIRSRYGILKSHASKWLILTTTGCAIVGLIIPYTPLGEFFGFVPLPPFYLAAIAGLVVLYLVIVEYVKRWFFIRYGW
ncbi:magnesium-translocating P-type ATPase [Sporomusa sp.]|uniref:magnesium-translocating P-type ATPase n=1 Tax=Sporomusa sp. TaxID=2078658 RepID=UPI002CFF52CF|nr:magnesium-translocating P-type ATPase [Sporomusa sp.]HWR45436.1 magnesium-translocating P-type ATPase [Sporomusa sp.]